MYLPGSHLNLLQGFLQDLPLFPIAKIFQKMNCSGKQCHSHIYPKQKHKRTQYPFDENKIFPYKHQKIAECLAYSELLKCLEQLFQFLISSGTVSAEIQALTAFFLYCAEQSPLPLHCQMLFWHQGIAGRHLSHAQ